MLKKLVSLLIIGGLILFGVSYWFLDYVVGWLIFGQHWGLFLGLLLIKWIKVTLATLTYKLVKVQIPKRVLFTVARLYLPHKARHKINDWLVWIQNKVKEIRVVIVASLLRALKRRTIILVWVSIFLLLSVGYSYKSVAVYFILTMPFISLLFPGWLQDFLGHWAVRGLLWLLDFIGKWIFGSLYYGTFFTQVEKNVRRIPQVVRVRARRAWWQWRCDAVDRKNKWQREYEIVRECGVSTQLLETELNRLQRAYSMSALRSFLRVCVRLGRHPDQVGTTGRALIRLVHKRTKVSVREAVQQRAERRRLEECQVQAWLRRKEKETQDNI